ncbi:LysR family transcriptional regulator [soil metagenome]
MRTFGFLELDAVLAVARRRNFRVAATDLGMSRSALSHVIADLETRLGVRLFNRTTRSVSLTQVGAQFVGDVTSPLGEIRGAMEKAGAQRSTPAGTLRINSSAGAARQVMGPILIEYLRRFPGMNVDIVTEGRMVDVVRDGFDAGIRLMESVPEDMIAMPVGIDQRFAVVGSPDYLKDKARPRSPTDLSQYACIRSRMPSGDIYRWEFERHGEKLTFDGRGPLTLDDPDLMLQAARAGLGFAYVTEFNAAADLAAGSLVRVLEDWTPAFPGLAFYYPSRSYLSAGLRGLIDLIRDSEPMSSAATVPPFPSKTVD